MLRWRGYQPAFFICGILFPILATIAVFCRLHATKIRSGRWSKPTADDWFIVLALIFCYAWSVNCIMNSQLGNLGGYGNFTSEGYPIPGPETTIFLQANYVSTVIVVPAIGFTKISIALLYRRLFASHNFRRWTWVLLGAIVAWTVAFTFAMLFQCWPLYAQWTPDSGGGCVDLWSVFMAGVASNTITDFLMLIWPIYEVWRLQMHIRRKLMVIGIFVLGGFVTIVGIIRLYYLNLSKKYLDNPLWNDITHNSSPAILWTIVELNVGVICACLPLVRPLYEGYHLDTITGSVMSLISGTRTRSVSSESSKTKYSLEAKSGEHVRVRSIEISDPETTRPVGQRISHDDHPLSGPRDRAVHGRSFTVEGGQGSYATQNGHIGIRQDFELSEVHLV